MVLYCVVSSGGYELAIVENLTMLAQYVTSTDLYMYRCVQWDELKT